MYAIVKEYKYSHQKCVNTAIVACCRDLSMAHQAVEKWSGEQPSKENVSAKMQVNVVTATEWQTDSFMSCSERWYIANMIDYA